jgi:hypothetical protein
MRQGNQDAPGLNYYDTQYIFEPSANLSSRIFKAKIYLVSINTMDRRVYESWLDLFLFFSLYIKSVWHAILKKIIN